MIIRLAHELDLDAMRALFVEHVRATRASVHLLLEERHGMMSDRGWESRVANEVRDDHAFVALEKRQVIGFVSFTLDEPSSSAEIIRFAVSAPHQEQHVDLSLVRQAVNYLRSRGVRTIETKVLDVCGDVVALFEQAGLATVDRRLAFSVDTSRLPDGKRRGTKVRQARVAELPRLREQKLCDSGLGPFWVAEVGGDVVSACRVEIVESDSLARITQIRSAARTRVETPVELVLQTARALASRRARVLLGWCAESEHVSRIAFQRSGFDELCREVLMRLHD